jgi:acyl-CoA synthetase (AMP-forming)/AMP-acid ligase II
MPQKSCPPKSFDTNEDRRDEVEGTTRAGRAAQRRSVLIIGRSRDDESARRACGRVLRRMLPAAPAAASKARSVRSCSLRLRGPAEGLRPLRLVDCPRKPRPPQHPRHSAPRCSNFLQSRVPAQGDMPRSDGVAGSNHASGAAYSILDPRMAGWAATSRSVGTPMAALITKGNVAAHSLGYLVESRLSGYSVDSTIRA